MNVSSILVAGGDAAGLAVASALARHGLEVALVEPTADWPDVAAADAVRAAGVELRLELGLIGVVDVDSHVEAELSNGSVENYDVVVIADDAARALALGGSRRVLSAPGLDGVARLAEGLAAGSLGD